MTSFSPPNLAAFRKTKINRSFPKDEEFFAAVGQSVKSFTATFWANNKALRKVRKISYHEQHRSLRARGFRTDRETLSAAERGEFYLFSLFYLGAIAQYWGKSMTVMLYGDATEGEKPVE